MCGGMDGHEETEAPQTQYTAPDLKALYAAFKASGTVPYSYYGQGAPTREGELDAVRAAYPEAFKAAPPPQQPSPVQQGADRHGTGLDGLMSTLFQGRWR